MISFRLEIGALYRIDNLEDITHYAIFEEIDCVNLKYQNNVLRNYNKTNIFVLE